MREEIIQSYLITSARYDFSVYEKRVLYRIVEQMQGELKGQPIGKGIKVQSSLFGDKKITMPISMFFLPTEEKHNGRIKRAFEDLMKKGITKTYEDGKQVGYPIIQFYAVTPKDGQVLFQLSSELQDDLLNFAKGYSQYELQVAFSFQSQYTMRMYELTCKNKRDITYSIDRLKEIFCLTEKYHDTYNFIKRVILPAERELRDSQSSQYFSFVPIKMGKSITSLRFKTHNRKKAEDTNPLFSAVDGDKPLVKLLAKTLSEPKMQETIAYMNNQLGTTDRTWKKYHNLLQENITLPKTNRQEYELADIVRRAKNADNPVGYVVNALKQRVLETKAVQKQIGKM